jgi:hypothetical protein
MKFSFGLLITLLNTPSLATSLSASPPVGGSCADPFFEIICGGTPNGDTQYAMLPEDCDTLLEFVECTDDDCYENFVFCTAGIDNARAQGYECFIEAFDACFAPRSEEEAAKASKFIEDIRSSLPMNGGTTMLSSGPISSHLATKECVSVQCGTAPNGVKQSYLLDPANCGFSQSGACGPSCIFCAEDAEIEKTRFSSSYECLGNVTEGPPPFFEVIIPLCEE